MGRRVGIILRRASAPEESSARRLLDYQNGLQECSPSIYTGGRSWATFLRRRNIQLPSNIVLIYIPVLLRSNPVPAPDTQHTNILYPNTERPPFPCARRKITLTLDPSKAIQDPKATPTDYDFSEPSEFDRVVKVTDKECDSYGTGDLWYWEDEDMAKRLVDHLRPPPSTLALPKRKEQMTPQPQSKGWGLFGKKKIEARPPLIDESRSSKAHAGARSLGKEGEDRVVVDVKAEEVVFRTENEYGMYGTERGWGVVVKLRVVLGRR